MNLNFEEEIKKKKRIKIIKESIFWLIEIAAAVLVAFLLVYFCLRRTSTIGSAMEPTLYNGQEVIINTKAYLFLEPDREDIVAFYEQEGEADGGEEPLIAFRRVIGLPGEKIRIENGKIWINGEEFEEKYKYKKMATAGIAEQELQLADDEYFVLCDSRVDSADSRSASFGNVKQSQIIGKVLLRVKPFSIVRGPGQEAVPTQTPKPDNIP